MTPPILGPMAKGGRRSEAAGFRLEMSADIIISYDGTPNDDDALALGRLLERTGARLALAYVRHSREYDPGREQLAQHDANRRLEQGAAWLGSPDIDRHVTFSASTGEGLTQLAAAEGASLVAFGSDYRTPPGRVEPGGAAQQMLEGGTVAIAVAPAGLRANADARISFVAAFPDGEDPAVTETADALASALGATIVSGDGHGDAQLLVVGSQSGGATGRIALSGAMRSGLDRARSAVLVLPRRTAVRF